MSGTELRYQTQDSLPSSPGAGFAFCYTFDPQGNLSQRLRYGGVFSTSGYDGFGFPEYFQAASQYDAYFEDPVGFGGQHGYFTDPETGLSLLTHRYYDAGKGRFVTRDPIGYKGGINLYGFADGNPVNESDPDGYNPLSRFLGRELSAFERAAHKAGQFAMELGEEGAKAKAEGYGDLTPGIPEPPIIAGSPDSRAAQEENAEVGRTQKLPKGGTYILRDPVNGKVMRTGMATTLVKRKSDHKQKYPGLVFEVDKRSNSKDARRGREQIIHDLYQPPYNKQNPIKRENYTPEEYQRMMDAGRKL